MLNADPIPTYSVGELNAAIGSLLERGFAPRFLVDASVSRPQLKKGHLWLTLTDGDASISAVVWASRRQQLSYQPKDGDGVTVVGKLNFWEARANLTVQALDIRPSLATVLRLPPEGEAADVYGAGDGDAVLVRPDRFIAARWHRANGAAIRSAITRICAGGLQEDGE